jgi:hypothetical protein
VSISWPKNRRKSWQHRPEDQAGGVSVKLAPVACPWSARRCLRVRRVRRSSNCDPLLVKIAWTVATGNVREHCMIYGGPGFLAPCPPPFPLLPSEISTAVYRKTEKERQLADGKGCQTIRQRESLVLYKSLNTLWFPWRFAELRELLSIKTVQRRKEKVCINYHNPTPPSFFYIY